MKKNHRVVLLGIDGTDPVVIERLVRAGHMPHVKRLIRDGFFTEAVPSFTAKTPQNWTTIATGAEPGTHEIVDLCMQTPRQELGYLFSDRWAGVEPTPRTQRINIGFDSSWCRAEFVWNTAENHGRKPLVFNYACATPNTLRKGIWIGGSGSPDSLSEFSLDKPHSYVLSRDAASSDARIDHVPAGTAVRRVWEEPLCRSQRAGRQTVVFALVRNGKGDALAVFRTRDWRDLVGVLREGDETPYQRDTFTYSLTKRRVEGSYKFRLYRLSRGEAGVYRTKIFPTEGISDPPGVYEDLIAHCGEFMEFAKSHPGSGAASIDTFNDLHRELNRWFARAVVHLFDTHRPDLLMMKTHMLDDYVHVMLPGYTAYRAGRKSAGPEHDAFVEGYRIMDEMIGMIRRGLPKGVHLLVVSDHGGVPADYCVPVNDILYRAGLVKKVRGKSRAIDFARSACLAVPNGCRIHINLKGRQRGGIVPREDYEKVQEGIIDALLAYVCPLTGKHPFALAVRKQDAGILGINSRSEHAGDVLFFLRENYSVGPSGRVLADGRKAARAAARRPQTIGHHGDWPPGVHHEGVSDLAVFMGAGPLLKRNYRHGKVFRLTGVTPTLCRILDIPAPATCEGAPLHAAFRS